MIWICPMMEILKNLLIIDFVDLRQKEMNIGFYRSKKLNK